MEEKVEKYHYRFVDRDGNAIIGGEELYKKVQKGDRLYFSVPERTDHYTTWKRVRRRPAEIYKISHIVRVEKLT